MAITLPVIRLPRSPFRAALEAVRDYAQAEADALWHRHRALEDRVASLEGTLAYWREHHPDDEAEAGRAP